MRALKWLLLILACLAAAVFLVVSIVIDLKGGRLFSAFLNLLVLSIVVGTGVGLISGDVDY